MQAANRIKRNHQEASSLEDTYPGIVGRREVLLVPLHQIVPEVLELLLLLPVIRGAHASRFENTFDVHAAQEQHQVQRLRDQVQRSGHRCTTTPQPPLITRRWLAARVTDGIPPLTGVPLEFADEPCAGKLPDLDRQNRTSGWAGAERRIGNRKPSGQRRPFPPLPRPTRHPPPF